jgi:hypothetical protein
MAEKYDIFIFYSLAHEDRTWVRGLAEALQDQGFTVWYDEAEVKPGEPLMERIHEGLNESRNIVFLVGTGASKSNWTAAELGAALAVRKPIIPIVQEGTPPGDIPGPIRLRRYLRRQEPSTTAKEIARAIALERKVERK